MRSRLETGTHILRCESPASPPQYVTSHPWGAERRPCHHKRVNGPRRRSPESPSTIHECQRFSHGSPSGSAARDRKHGTPRASHEEASPVNG